MKKSPAPHFPSTRGVPPCGLLKDGGAGLNRLSLEVANGLLPVLFRDARSGRGDHASDLLGSNEELRIVRQLFPKGESWRLGEDPARLKQLATSHPLLHISTHGLTPDKSRLGGQLEGDGSSLSAFDLAELNLPQASLAVVATCESSVDASTGRDNSSLLSALRTAGAAQVIGSLWPLDDTVTSQLFKHFYQSLHDGATPAAALAGAQRAVAGRHTHPYYWAGLQLVSGP